MSVPTPAVLISLSSFGAAEVRRHGQLRFAELSADAGADGIEVRGELLNDARNELPQIGALARKRAVGLVYSSPEGLWADDGKLDEGALERGLDAARCLGAQRLKMSIGSYGRESAAGVARLTHVLAGDPTELVIENDHTRRGGTLPALQAFFDAVRSADLSLGMTFDMGNWHWAGEDALQAAAAFASKVAYVHCKGVQRRTQQWIAVPLAASAAPWRAILRALPADVPRAIEYPLQAERLSPGRSEDSCSPPWGADALFRGRGPTYKDLLAVTREQLALVRHAETAR